MKWVMLVLVLVLSIAMVSATQVDVVLIDDIGSFSGATLKIKASASGEPGDKIRASEYLTKVGIVKFKIETSLAEVFLSFVLTKNGNMVDEFVAGPFVINGSEILVDRREEVEREVIKDNVVNETNVSVVEEVVEPVIVEVGSEYASSDSADNNSLKEKISRNFLNGKTIFFNEDGSVNLGFSAGGGMLVLMFVIVMVFMVSKKGKKVKILSDDDKELAYMEKQMKETEEKISKIKDKDLRMIKINAVKAKLAKEKAELEELENGSAKDSGATQKDAEKIEDLG